MIYTDPVLGVDVSTHQPEFPWQKARDAGCEFAWIKTSEGTGYRDPWWVRHSARANAARFLWGGYHFARANGPDWRADAISEANWFVDCGGMDGPLPGALDMEHTDLSRDLTIRWCEVWCKRVKERAHYPRRIPVYVGGWFAGPGTAIMNDPRLADCWWWMPSYGADTPNPYPYGVHVGWNGGVNGSRVPDGWQYTQKGRIPGWPSGVDLNIAPRRAILELARLSTPPADSSPEEDDVQKIIISSKPGSDYVAEVLGHWEKDGVNIGWAPKVGADVPGAVFVPGPNTNSHAFVVDGTDVMHLGPDELELLHGLMRWEAAGPNPPRVPSIVDSSATPLDDVWFTAGHRFKPRP